MSLLAAIILISLILCAIAIPFFIRSFLWQSILKKIYAGQYDKAIQQMNAPLYTFLFSEYEKNYNILRTYISKQDTNEITKQVEFMLSQNLNNSQAYQVASMTYFYFLDVQNVELSKKLLDNKTSLNLVYQNKLLNLFSFLSLTENNRLFPQCSRDCMRFSVIK